MSNRNLYNTGMLDHRRLDNSRRDGYSRRTHYPRNCLVFVALPLAVFHLGSAFSGSRLLALRDLQRLLGFFGSAAWYLPPILVVTVLFAQHAFKRHRGRVEPAVLAGMLAESVLWATPLFAVNYLSARVLAGPRALAATAPVGGQTAFQQVLSAVGAGVYEEFVFRLLLVGLIVVASMRLLRLKKDLAVLVALLVSAVLFSLYHFSWETSPAGQAFTWGLFIFRAVAGMCLAVTYVYRGFGIAVGAHTLWNLFCVASQ